MKDILENKIKGWGNKRINDISVKVIINDIFFIVLLRSPPTLFKH